MKIGIVFALEEELKELKKKFKIKKEHNIFNLKIYETKYKENDIFLVQSGVGKVNAARTTQVLIDHMNVNYIFNIGVAGGLDNTLSIGNIVIGEKLVQHDFDITAFNHEKGYIPELGVFVKADEKLTNLAEKLIKDAKKGVIASGDIFCTDQKMSNKINKDFNALCVEMEGAAIAQVCYLDNIPFLILRSISDVPNNNNKITYEEFLESSSKKIAEAMYEILSNIK